MTNLKISTYISNYIPEFGYSTNESKEFLPIQHPEAKVAAQKRLDYEDQIYLNGYIEIIYEDKLFLNELEGTDDLLFTWDSFAQIIIKNDTKDEFEIFLLDNASTLKVIKDGANYKLILDSVHSEEQGHCISIVSIPSDELIEEIKISFKDFVDFCKSGLVFDEESDYDIMLQSYSKIKGL